MHFQCADVHQRLIDAYLTLPPHQSDSKLPLIVYVQGSGCSSHFMHIGDQIAGTTGHNLVYTAADGHARLLIVEKPGVQPFDAPKNPGGAEEGSDEFKREHTLDRWCDAIESAINAVIDAGQADPVRIMAIGHSEGGLVACRLAARDPRITHVACLAGGGATQLYDFLEMARSGHMFDHAGDTPDARAKYVIDSWAQVLAEPGSSDKLWLGHPYLRWSSFCATSPAEELLKTKAQVFIAQGSADQAVVPSSALVLQATLLAHGRDVHMDWIEGADHGFALPGQQSKPDGWLGVMREAVAWFLDNPKKSSVAARASSTPPPGPERAAPSKSGSTGAPTPQ